MHTSRSSSISSISSTPSEDTHQIFVKLLSGETIPLTVPSSTPITHLQHLLSVRTSAPAPSIRLVHAGRHLTAGITSTSPTANTEDTSNPPPPAPPTTAIPSSAPSLPTSSPTASSSSSSSSSSQPTLSTLSIPQNATLHITLPIRGGTSTTTVPPSKRKVKCNFKDCKAASQRIVGDCSFCQGHFCGNHRMLEDHKCTGLEDCKAEAHERNKEVLEGQKTVALKGI